jgi:5-methyltetrahydrofolate corrinoid/iron sulfur protein methyltransferase
MSERVDMIIVGELINSSRKPIAEAIKARNTAAVQQVARNQMLCGAAFVDVNAGVFDEQEAECLEWLVQNVQQATDAPCSIDSPNTKALEAALAVHQGSALINSISLERRRCEDITSLLAGTSHQVIALCMNERGVPETVDQRLANADKLVNHLVSSGIPIERVYLDPLLHAVSTKETAGRDFLLAVAAIKQRFPNVHCICGISNVSFGLPRRKLINQTFAAMAIAHGLDAAILNPLDAKLMTNILVAETLAGSDPWCERYLHAHREDRLSA